MRKCARCNVVFDDDTLVGCIYCENILTPIKEEEQEDDFVGEGKSLSAQGRPLTHQNKEYLFGNFFPKRTFLSSFAFSYNDIKRSKKAQRFFIQPIDAGYIIKIPLFIVNFIYSFFFHILNSQYCPWCNTRYFAFYGAQKKDHPREACEYCQEYGWIADEIFSGKKYINLKWFRKEAEKKIKKGKRSAYFDLVHRKVAFERFLDVASIVTSIVVYVYIIARLSMPIFVKIYQF